MSNDIRWKQRFNNFDKAYKTFCRIISTYEQDKKSEVVKMAVIQAYEFTVELSWKVLKDFLEKEEVINAKSPKQVIRQSFQLDLIDDAEKWLEALKRRNLTSHVYSPEVLQETVDFIYNDFSKICSDLHSMLEKEL